MRSGVTNPVQNGEKMNSNRLRLVRRGPVLAASVAALLLAGAPAALAQSAQSERIVRRATEAYLATMTDPKKQIPYPVLRKAIAIAIFPGVTKAGLVIGGSGGEGVLLARRGGGWTGPAFYNFGAASVGIQIGVQKADIFLLIMTEKALASFMKRRTTLGSDASVAAGPEGAAGKALQTGSAGIVSYSRVSGAFAGASLEGARISFSNRYNDGYWGTPMRAQQVLLSPPSNLRVPASARHLRGFMVHSPERSLVGAVQVELMKKGFYNAGIDGEDGTGTRDAITAYQRAQGIKPTGQPTTRLLERLRAKSN